MGSTAAAPHTEWWRAAAPASIPSKTRLHRSFTTVLGVAENVVYERYNTAALVDLPAADKRKPRPASEGASAALRVLDLGCGDGRIALGLGRHGLDVVGVDVNAAAVAAATLSAAAEPEIHSNGGSARFIVGDCCAAGGPLVGDSICGGAPGFDVVLSQLVISIVGGYEQRQRLLLCAREMLRPGGILLLSASAVSMDINPEYEQTYARGKQETGEDFSYLSRDAESGAVLYMTHHFSYAELRALIAECGGFTLHGLHKEKETSSRRPDQAAWFLYAVVVRDPDSGSGVALGGLL